MRIGMITNPCEIRGKRTSKILATGEIQRGERGWHLLSRYVQFPTLAPSRSNLVRRGPLKIIKTREAPWATGRKQRENWAGGLEGPSPSSHAEGQACGSSSREERPPPT